ncbi:caspase-7-like [Pelobates cultripes]|uniref:Caspase-7-like n=1 Tax=Pelobates cultripes TaxID=61616 RepID=A0AAD1RNP6_PELCU|nr:caspase-7-like [Pelobates cultripes]
MSNAKRGRALIIAMTEFHNRSERSRDMLEPRKGVKRDTDRLFRALSLLGYNVSLHLDVSAREIREIYHNESRFVQGECFISILSSHGQEGLIYDFYGEPVYLRDLYDSLSPKNCPALAGIPKLFFIQACRGKEIDEGVVLETDSAECEADTFCHSWNLPSDTVVMFATSEGYVAFQNPAGSFFLQTLCDIIEGEERELALNQIFTLISYHTAYNFQSRGTYAGYKEMPCFITNLTKELRPFRQLENTC